MGGWFYTKIPERGKEEVIMIERSEFKGNPMIILRRNEDDKFPFSFGLTKAKLILSNIDEIKQFVAEHDPAFDPAASGNAG